MKYFSTLMVFLVSNLLYSTLSFALPNSPVDNSVAVINLRSNCIEGGVEINNCFNNLPGLLDWVWDVRKPSSASPLLVNIGPGKFDAKPGLSQDSGSFCINAGHVTFRGAGQERTMISAPADSGVFGITVKNCDSLAFENLTLNGGPSLYGFMWSGNGSSTYTNVILTANGFAWYDNDCVNNNNSVHYFFGSKIIASSDAYGNTVGYVTFCATTWFYGSEIKAIGTQTSARVNAILANGGEVHVYGSAIRALTEENIPASDITAVNAMGASQVHIHGTGIDVITDTSSDVTSLAVSGGAKIHASEASYVLQSNGGLHTRLANNGGTFQAPFLWQQDVPTGLRSEHGADMLISTNITSEQPHIILYSDKCPSKWFDSTLNQCKQ